MTDLYRQPVTHPEPYAYRSFREDGSVRCKECGDSEWVEVASTFTGIPTVRPCSQCKPDTWKRWLAGFPGRGGSRHGGDDPEPASMSAPTPPQQEQF